MHLSSREYWRVRAPFCRRSDRESLSPKDATLLRNFATALTTAMARAGTKRVIVESTAFLFKDSIVPPIYLLGRLLFPGVVANARTMEDILNGVGWTRPWCDLRD